jgi:hypothetical protein
MSRKQGSGTIALVAACLIALCLGGCLEPSGLSKPEEIYEAFALRDGGNSSGGSAGTSSGGMGGSSSGGSGGMGGSGGTMDSGALGPCGDVLEDLLKPRCATSGCHNAATGGPLNFEASDLAAELVNAEASALCEDEVYIDSADAEQSLIYTKLASSPPCGSRMPLIGEALGDDEKACVLEFVEGLLAE